MNKIFKYFLGVFGMLNMSVCLAADKFEILPDLPEALSYAVQPASASTISGVNNSVSALNAASSVGSEPSFISVTLSLVFVILLIYFTGIIYAKLNKVNFKTFKKQNGALAQAQVSVLSTTPLGNNKTLHVVELDGKRMLIGASSAAIHLIKDLGNYSEDEDEEYSKIEIPNIKIPKIEIPKIEIPSIGFSKIVTKTHKKFKFDEEEHHSETENDEPISQDAVEQEAKMEETNSEGIIDSLFSQPETVNIQNNTDKSIEEHKVNPEEFVLYKKYL